MKIQWFGQSFFAVISNQGTNIAMDPFHNNVGYPLPNISADILTISHNHKDHNNIELIDGNPKIISKPGEYLEKDISIKGILSSHGKFLGKNIIFKFLIDGLSLCHLGDLGVLLNDDQINQIGKTDILLVPIGGGLQVLNAGKACKVIEKLNPQIIIPMHYKTEVMKRQFFMFHTEDHFCKMMHGTRLDQNWIDISQNTLQNKKGTYILDFH